jgi:hypothetical protein
MANSLRAKLSKLKHDGHIDNAEYQELIKKLDGHDRELRNKAIEEFAEVIKSSQNVYTCCCTDSPMEFCDGDGCEMCVLRFKKEIDEIAESMKKELK